jgi:hypothetical protein
VYKKRLRIAWAIIDETDLPLVEPYLWRLHNAGYAWVYTDAKGRHGTSMHRHLCGLAADDPREVDHLNGDRLDNRRSNLRVCTRAENAQNSPSRFGTSRHRGVSWNFKREKWVAQGKINGRNYYLGQFDDELAAARVAAAWREEHFTFANVARDVIPQVDERDDLKEAA